MGAMPALGVSHFSGRLFVCLRALVRIPGSMSSAR
jgi:hypothetical protein